QERGGQGDDAYQRHQSAHRRASAGGNQLNLQGRNRSVVSNALSLLSIVTVRWFPWTRQLSMNWSSWGSPDTRPRATSPSSAAATLRPPRPPGADPSPVPAPMPYYPRSPTAASSPRPPAARVYGIAPSRRTKYATPCSPCDVTNSTDSPNDRTNSQ